MTLLGRKRYHVLNLLTKSIRILGSTKSSRFCPSSAFEISIRSLSVRSRGTGNRTTTTTTGFTSSVHCHHRPGDFVELDAITSHLQREPKRFCLTKTFADPELDLLLTTASSIDIANNSKMMPVRVS